MALPHPHGSASGQIAHNSSYDTGITPGSTGGKFIGFGEQGTSAFANRPHWALSENIDYIYQIIAADRAIPACDAFTVAGGGESTHQILDDVWVGNSGYPVDATEGLMLLFNVLDDQYNELVDVNGNEVVAAIVRDSTDTTDVYKTGFETDPVVTFKTIDNTGADVTNPYTIPAATEVRLMYAFQGSLESLPVDALSLFKVQSGDEAPAGVFRTDGSVPMAGNADWAGYDLNNIGDIVGKTGQDVLLRSLQDLNFQDQYAGPIPFSESGQTALLGSLNTSLLATINSELQHTRSVMANRTLARGGDILFQGSLSGRITLPAGMIVSVNGEAVNVGGQLIAAATGNRWGVIDSTGTFVERASAPLATDVPVTYHNFNGVDTFTTAYDIRWTTNGLAGLMKITVSKYHPDADFTDLVNPVNMIRVLHQYTNMASPISYVIEVIDEVDLDETLYPTIPITIKGHQSEESLQWPKINWIGADGDDVIDCSGQSIKLEDITIRVGTGVTPTGSAVVRNPGSNSVFKNTYFKWGAGTASWANGIVWDTGTEEEILIDGCYFDRCTAYCIDASGATSISKVRIRDSYIEAGSSALHCMDLRHEFNYIDDCEIVGGDDEAIILGPNSQVRGCALLSASLTAKIIDLFEPSGTGFYLADEFNYRIENNLFRASTQEGAIYCGWTSAGTKGVHVNIHGNTFYQQQRAISIENTLAGIGEGVSYAITNNHFVEMASNDDGVYLDTALNVTISGNVWSDCDGTLIHLIQHNRAVITGNIFESYRWSTGDSMAIEVDDSGSSDEEVIIQGNIFTGNGAGSDPTAIKVDASNVTIDGNHFGTDVTTLEVGVYMVSGVNNKITNNNFRQIIDKSVWIDMSAESEPDGYVQIDGNIFNPPDAVLGVAAVYIVGTPGCRIINNKFVGDRSDADQDGRAIYVLSLTRSVDSTVINHNEFRNIIGKPTSGTDYRVVWVNGTTAGADGTQVNNNYFDKCGTDENLAVISRIVEVAGDGYQICGNVIKDSYGPQNSSGSQQLIYATGAVYDYAVINDNSILEDSLTSAGRITLGDWSGIKASSVTTTACRNEFHTINYDTSITANGTTEYFLDIAGGLVCYNVMGLRVRNTVTTKRFIAVGSGTGQFIGNSCRAATHDMDFGSGDKAVVIGNTQSNSIGGTISQTGEELIAVGNSSYASITFSGGGTTPGIVIANIVYGGGTTNTGSHATSGNA